jgi:hypothetical protein
LATAATAPVIPISPTPRAPSGLNFHVWDIENRDVHQTDIRICWYVILRKIGIDDSSKSGIKFGFFEYRHADAPHGSTGKLVEASFFVDQQAYIVNTREVQADKHLGVNASILLVNVNIGLAKSLSLRNTTLSANAKCDAIAVVAATVSNSSSVSTSNPVPAEAKISTAALFRG